MLLFNGKAVAFQLSLLMEFGNCIIFAKIIQWFVRCHGGSPSGTVFHTLHFFCVMKTMASLFA